nr:MAG TPA: hypothetical protein [Caudoviricetes sp.]
MQGRNLNRRRFQGGACPGLRESHRRPSRFADDYICP